MRHRQEFFLRQEFVKELGLVWHGPETAAHIEFKTTPLLAVHNLFPGNGAHVVHAGKPACVFFAAGKGHLEFPSEILGVRMAQQELGARLGIRSHVKSLISAYPRDWACRHVTDPVATCLSRSDTNGSKPPH